MKDQREAAQRHGLIEHVVGQQVSGIAETHHRTQGAQIEHVIGVDFLVKIFKSEDPREKEHGGKQDGKQDPQSVIDENDLCAVNAGNHDGTSGEGTADHEKQFQDKCGNDPCSACVSLCNQSDHKGEQYRDE